MQLDYDKIMKEANLHYSEAVIKRNGYTAEDVKYWAPEQFPEIESEQAKAITKAIVDAINSEAFEFIKAIKPYLNEDPEGL